MELTFISRRGDTLSLSENEYFYLINVDGQTSATASLSSSVMGGSDGDTITSVQTQPREITLDLRIKSGVDVELAKEKILDVVKLKQKAYLVWTQRGKTVQIQGIVESIEMPRWNNAVTMQIALHCEIPYWEDIDEVIEEINGYQNMHYFTDSMGEMLYFPSDGIVFGVPLTTRTKTIYNGGSVPVGVEITITALGTVTNPIITDSEGRFFGVGYGTGNKQVVMNSGDTIIITTHKGNKTVKKNGVSLFSKIRPHSTWLQLETGDNEFVIDSDDEDLNNVIFTMNFKRRYI